MDDGDLEGTKTIIMGATGNPNTTRLATLQERKKNIEESLAKCNQELKQICMQEADLTGVIPQEMPLEPGESPPLIRRRVGTSYQLPENLLNNANNKNEPVSDLELQMQLHANLAEAALGLANDQNISKTLRRQHMAQYQQHKIQFTTLQEKITTVKDKQQNEQLHKHKKKPRPAEQEDNVSVGTVNELFAKSDLRHSMRSSKYTGSDGGDSEHRFPASYPRVSYKNVGDAYVGQEEVLTRGLYSMSINGYKNYIERRESITNNHISGYSTLQYNHHTVHAPPPQYPTMNMHYQSYHQPAKSTPSLYNYPNPNQNYMKNLHSPTNHLAVNLRLQHRKSSPSTNTPKNFYSASGLEHNHNYIMYAPDGDQNFHASSPHQIQPHQQYEHMTTGLGGYWKRLESGEVVWCNSSPMEGSWQRDKRFGSLDRRKNKRLHKRVSPSVDNKSATLATVPAYTEHLRNAALKSPQVINKKFQDRQLVRTQSLGSVGGQTVDIIWPSDDNSSCESDSRSINEARQAIRKQKQKEWMETSLDGPVSPPQMPVSRSQSALPSVLSPDDKYIVTPPQPIPPPVVVPKAPLEIPAESNPSPRIPDANIELFNNNIPKNCTVVQAGHCKPYHEETKPFEMSDFYKYSTKFKKSPVKQDGDTVRKSHAGGASQKNLNESFGHSSVDNSLNSSFDLHQNVVEHFSDEMNAWYKSHKLQFESGGEGGASKAKSTATLV